MDRITFHVWKNSNYAEVSAFVGEEAHPPCPVCGGAGEYEGEYGPKACQPCNSRCFDFIDHSGKRVYADDGDVIEKHEDGLHLIQTIENRK